MGVAASPQAGVCRLRALGSLAIYAENGATEVGGVRLRRLLALLLVNRGSPVPVDRLIDVVFEGDPTPEAEATLRSYVSRLRRVLASASDSFGPEVLSKVPAGYVLAVSDDAFDVAVFERLVVEGQSKLRSHDAAAAEQSVMLALDEWRGSPYPEFAHEEWAQLEVQHLEELRRGALETLVDARLESGSAALVVADLESLVGEFPYAEGFRERLMVALYRVGRHTEAVDVFQSYRRLLGEERGLEPSPQLAELEHRILSHDPTLAEEVGTPLRGYRLGARLGRGRDGITYAAAQPGIDADLVVRSYDAALADNPHFIRTFEDEARRIAALGHEAIVEMRDYWREPGAAYLVMRRLTGGSLQDRLDAGDVGQAELAEVIARVGQALGAAEAIGVSHGRIGLGSILFDTEGRAVVTDFALGRDDPGAHARDVAGIATIVLRGLLGTTSADAGTFSRLPAPVSPLVGAGLDPTVGPSLDLVSYADDIRAALAGDAPTAAHVANPYRGLQAFDETDRGWFFGRKCVIDQLIDHLGRPGVAGRLVLVVGSSGSGKSSVVRAGMLPAARSGLVEGSERWLVTTMLPGTSPYKALSEALSHVAVRLDTALLDELAADKAGIDAVLRRSVPAGAQVLLVIDQMEELFTLSRRDEVQRFLSGLVYALERPDSLLRVAATLRADFYDRPLGHPSFGPLVQAATVTVPAMDATELEAAIVGPARASGLSVELGLVSLLVMAVVNEPAALPALQYVLFLLAENGDGAELTLESYETLGGVDGAIAGRAETLYSSLDEADRLIVREAFEGLVTISPDGEVTRRRAIRHDLVGGTEVGRHEDAIEWFIEARLLSSGRDADTRAPTLEVAHEALLTEWPRLRAWIAEDKDELAALAALRDAAKAWSDHGGDPELLYRGARLDQASAAAARHRAVVTAAEHEFLDASVGAREAALRVEADQIERQARTNRRLKGLLVAVGVALAFAAGAALVAIDRWTEADGATAEVEAQKDIALQAAADARLSAAEADTARLVATAENLVGENQRLALLLATEAYQRDPSPASASVLLDALTAGPGFLGYVGSFPEDAYARFASDGSIVVRTVRYPAGDGASGPFGEAGTSEWDFEPWHAMDRGAHDTLIYDATGVELLRTIDYPGIGPFAAAGDRPVVAVQNGDEVAVFDVTTGQRSFTVDDAGPTWFAPNGDLVIGQADGSLHVYDQHGVTLTGFEGGGTPADPRVGGMVKGLAFTHDGQLMATADGAPGGVRVWEYAGREERDLSAMFPGAAAGTPSADALFMEQGPVSVVFSPDDSYLAVGYRDGRLELRRTSDWAMTSFRDGSPAIFAAEAGPVRDIHIIDTDPVRIVAIGFGNIVHWSLGGDPPTGTARDQAAPVEVVALTRPIRTLDHHPGSASLISGSTDVARWSSDDRGLIAEPLGAPVLGDVSVSPDGRYIIKSMAGAARLGQVTRFDRVMGEEVVIAENALFGSELSPDGTRLIVAEALPGWRDSTLRLLDADTLEQIGPATEVPCCLQRRAWSRDGRYLAIAYGWHLAVPVFPINDTDGLIDIFEIGDDGLVRTARITEARDRWGGIWPAGLWFSHDGTRLLTDSGGPTFAPVVAEWSVPDGALLRPPSEINELAPGIPLGHASQSEVFAWRSAEGIVLVDDDSFRAQGDLLLGVDETIWRAEFSPDDTLLVTYGDAMGGPVTIWDVEQRTRIGPTLPNHAYWGTEVGVNPTVLAADSEVGQAVVTTTPNQLLAWQLEPSAWPAIACAAAGRNLTFEEWEQVGPAGNYQPTCDQWPAATEG